MPTIQDCEYAWGRYTKIKENAPEYDKALLEAIDIRFAPTYASLHENWNENKAKVFLNGMNYVFHVFGEGDFYQRSGE